MKPLSTPLNPLIYLHCCIKFNVSQYQCIFYRTDSFTSDRIHTFASYLAWSIALTSLLDLFTYTGFSWMVHLSSDRLNSAFLLFFLAIHLSSTYPSDWRLLSSLASLLYIVALRQVAFPERFLATEKDTQQHAQPPLPLLSLGICQPKRVGHAYRPCPPHLSSRSADITGRLWFFGDDSEPVRGYRCTSSRATTQWRTLPIWTDIAGRVHGRSLLPEGFERMLMLDIGTDGQSGSTASQSI